MNFPAFFKFVNAVDHILLEIFILQIFASEELQKFWLILQNFFFVWPFLHHLVNFHLFFANWVEIDNVFIFHYNQKSPYFWLNQYYYAQIKFIKCHFFLWQLYSLYTSNLPIPSLYPYYCYLFSYLFKSSFYSWRFCLAFFVPAADSVANNFSFHPKMKTPKFLKHFYWSQNHKFFGFFLILKEWIFLIELVKILILDTINFILKLIWLIWFFLFLRLYFNFFNFRFARC